MMERQAVEPVARRRSAGELQWQERQYELVVFPEGAGGERVQQLAAELRAGAAGGEKPRILLGTFVAKEAMEETLIRWIQRVCRLQQRFRVSLEGPLAHPAGGWHLRVRDQWPFGRLAEGLAVIDPYLVSCGGRPAAWHRIPHCRLSEQPPEKTRAIPGAAAADFEAAFWVHSIVLLKSGREGGTELVNVFPLLP